jgi:hypothetical protein
MPKFLLAICLLLITNSSLAQQYSLTYSAAIGGPNNYTTATPTACPGTLTFTNIPAGSMIDSVRVSYSFFTSMAGFGNPSMQRSYLRCLTTQTDEQTLTAPSGSGPGTTNNYTRVVTIANGVLNGPLTFELHAGSADPLSFSSCTGSANVVVANSWTVTVYTSQGSCLQPQQLALTQHGGDSVHFNWTHPGSAMAYQLRYGLASGSGSVTTLSSTQPQLGLGGLNQATEYAVAVRAICGAGDTSMWTPDLLFTTDTFSCAAPDTGWGYSAAPGTAVLYWRGQAHAQNFDLTYGPRNFTPGTGTLVNVIVPDSLVLSGLTATNYDFYVRQYCGLTYSSWAGPFAFNLSTVGLEDLVQTAVRIYPQPATDYVMVSLDRASAYTLYDLQGKELQHGKWHAGEHQLSLQNLNAGIYILELAGRRLKILKGQ